MVGLGALLASVAFAGETSGKKEVVIEDPKNFCDDWKSMFGINPIYESDGGLIQEIKLIGRYQGQYHNTESDQGDDSDWENRRFRFGTEIKFLNDFKFQGQFNLKRDFDVSGRLFESVEDLTIAWKPDGSGFSITAGKQKAYLTRDWNTSSTKIKTMERSLLTNNVVPDKVGGVILSIDETGPLKDTKFGIVSGSTDDDWDYPTFDGGLGVNFSTTYGLSEATDIRFDYLYTDNDAEANKFKGFEHTFSLNSASEWDRLHLETDVIYGVGEGSKSDIFGVVIMPYYEITDKLEGVFRYTYANADEANGISVQSRYERAAAGKLRGDEYHAFYLGLNYYVCGDNLKLMGGVEFSSLDGQNDNDYITYWSGVRLYF